MFALKTSQAKTYAILAIVGLVLTAVLFTMDKISPIDIAVASLSYIIAIAIHTLLIECMFHKCKGFPTFYYYLSLFMAVVLIFTATIGIMSAKQ
jgi:prolipoprotein diacylglyceryltransferase